MKKAITMCLITLTTLSAVSCGDSRSSTSKAAELTHQRKLVEIQLDAERQRMELDLKRLREEQRIADQREKSRQADAQRQRVQENSSARTRTTNAIKSLNLRTRDSLMDEFGKVLIITNPNPFSVDFNLKCTARSGYTKTIFVSVGARASTEVGFLEGWDGNFRSGETIELQLNTETIVNATIP